MKQCDFKPISYFGTFARGKSKHRPRNDKALYGGKYPFIQTADVGKADYYITDYVQTYNEKGLAQSKLWPEGTLCITIAANIADTAVLAFPACFPDSIIGFTPYPEISNTRYVKACFDMYKQECRQISQGAAQDNLSWSKLSQIKFPAPPYDVQCKIASVLLVFDNLIEINKKRIELLQESCFLYYSSLNFHGYELKSLFDFGCRLESGRRPSGGIIPSLQNGIPSVGAENVIGLGKYNYSSEKYIESEYFSKMKTGKIRDKDILIYKDGAYIGKTSLFQDCFPHKQAAVNEHVFLLHSNEDIYQYYLYFTLAQKEYFQKMQNLNSNSAQPGLTQRALLSLELPKPPIEVVAKFNNFVSPFMSEIFVLAKQNKQLVDQRELMMERIFAKLSNN